MNLRNIFFVIILTIVSLFSQSKFTGRIGLGIGYNIGYDMTDFSVISKKFLIENDVNKLSEGFFTNNFYGYFYTLLIPNTRMGFIYINGGKVNDLPSSYSKFIKFSKELTGLTFEYTFSLSSANISLGFIFGKGENSILVLNYLNRQSFDDFTNAFKVGQSISSFTGTLVQNFYEISPSLIIELSIHRFIAIRFGGFYHNYIYDDWKLGDEVPFEGVPVDLISNSFSFSIGLLVGFFSR